MNVNREPATFVLNLQNTCWSLFFSNEQTKTMSLNHQLIFIIEIYLKWFIILIKFDPPCAKLTCIDCVSYSIVGDDWLLTLGLVKCQHWSNLAENIHLHTTVVYISSIILLLETTSNMALSLFKHTKGNEMPWSDCYMYKQRHLWQFFWTG